jgi:hypothetical protein
MSDDEWWEYGYEVDGEQVWAYDHGGDGEWTPARPDLNMPHVDITYGDEKSVHRKIYEALDRAGVNGVVITRRVTRGAIEHVERPTSMHEGADQ